MAKKKVSAAEDGEAAAEGGKKKLIIMVVAGLVVMGAAYFFVLKPGGSAEAAPPEKGKVVALEPIQLNLAGGYYLRVGIALQLTKEAYEADGSYALDQLISTFSQVPMEEAMDPKKREERRQHLLEKLDKHYKGDVMDVYFTEFVTQ